MRRLLAILALSLPLLAPAEARAADESVDHALCALIEPAARAHGIPVRFLTRLIWRESSFRSNVVSPAGAQGIAQFMPGTAAERGLQDPFDPEEAIPASAHFIADLRDRFGSLGLAAAAYNGGPTRVANWLAAADASLPLETEDYVAFITGIAAEDWKQYRGGLELYPSPWEPAGRACPALVASIRKESPVRLANEGIFAPWGVQLSGDFSKSKALRRFERTRRVYAAVLGNARPMIIGTRLKSRGARRFYRVRAPAATRREAEVLCAKLRARGGACVVFRSR